jgi:hypothetical protein
MKKQFDAYKPIFSVVEGKKYSLNDFKAGSIIAVKDLSDTTIKMCHPEPNIINLKQNA